jgi:hypothetical protein
MARHEATAWADVSPIRWIDGATKAKVLAALAGLIVLGFKIVALNWHRRSFAARRDVASMTGRAGPLDED